MVLWLHYWRRKAADLSGPSVVASGHLKAKPRTCPLSPFPHPAPWCPRPRTAVWRTDCKRQNQGGLGDSLVNKCIALTRRNNSVYFQHRSTDMSVFWELSYAWHEKSSSYFPLLLAYVHNTGSFSLCCISGIQNIAGTQQKQNWQILK